MVRTPGCGLLELWQSKQLMAGTDTWLNTRRASWNCDMLDWWHDSHGALRVGMWVVGITVLARGLFQP